MAASILAELTKEQQTVVKHTKGPLLVIAGAGTGKTRVLTHRIAYLVEQKIATPDEIVALTFTDKAASEMSERVDQLLPLGTNSVTITTFHSFTADILRHNSHWLGRPADFALLNTEEELVFLRQQLFALPLKELRPGSNPTKFLGDLLKFFNRLRDEAVTPAELAQEAGRLQASEETNDEGIVLTELAATFDRYEQLLLENGYLTFGHLITLTLELLQKRPSVLRQLQKQYRWFLIDEYQDTNWAQTELAAVLAGQTGNIMVVGDDDQAIYSFRGAAATNLLDFTKRFPKCRTVLLTKNYRSSQNILDAAYRLIQHNNPDRLEYSQKIDKRLFGQSGGEAPELILYDRLAAEMKAAAKTVGTWLKKGLAPQEIAILTRTKGQAAAVAEALRQEGIAVSAGSEQPLLEQPIIKSCLACLQLLLNPNDNQAFFAAASYHPFFVGAETLNRLVSACRYRDESYLYFTKEELARPNRWLPDRDRQILTKLIDCHGQLAAAAHGRPSVAFLRLIHQSNLYGELNRRHTPESEQQMTQLGELFERMQAYEERHRHATLSEFLHYLDILADNDQDEPSVTVMDPFTVQVMTVHQSKGLEFTAVLIPFCTTNRFPSKRQRTVLPIPEGLIKSTALVGDQHLEEERRLFYVAMTRAKKWLSFSAAQHYGQEKSRAKLSPFVLEALGEEAATSIVRQLSASEYLQINLPLEKTEFAVQPRPTGPLTVSYTNLNTYLQCPWQYRYRVVLKVKTYPSAVMNFGNVMHQTLHAYLDSRRRQEPADIGQLLEKYWIPDGYESRQQERIRKQEGRVALQALVKELDRVSFERLEWGFEVPLPTGDRLKGRLDRLDRDENGRLHIIDYKTGAPQTERRAKQDLQLGLYILAAETALKTTVSSVSLHYVMTDHKITISRDDFNLPSVTEKLMTALKSLKEDTAANSFTAKPDMHNCRYCDYRSICPFKYTK